MPPLIPPPFPRQASPSRSPYFRPLFPPQNHENTRLLPSCPVFRVFCCRPRHGPRAKSRIDQRRWDNSNACEFRLYRKPRRLPATCASIVEVRPKPASFSPSFLALRSPCSVEQTQGKTRWRSPRLRFLLRWRHRVGLRPGNQGLFLHQGAGHHRRMLARAEETGIGARHGSLVCSSDFYAAHGRRA